MVVSTAYSLREVERLLGVSDDTLKRWLRSGRIHGFRLPGQNGAWRIEDAEIARIKVEGQSEGSR
jgi:excisionase family DNA binding protein